MYVNLEPCCHHGKTPPCTDIIIESGIKKVVIATVDPYNKVSGKGIEILKASGIDVEVGILENIAKTLNEAFFKRVTTGLPYVIYKSAMTLDGKIALENGESQWITSLKSRKLAHFIRSGVDAILTGSGTMIRDNPSFDVRLKKSKRNPLPLIIDAELKIPENAKLFNDASSRGTILFTSNSANSDKIRRLKYKGVRIISIPEGKDLRHSVNNIGRSSISESNVETHIDLEIIMHKITELGISTVLLECGGNLAYTMLQKGLLDKLYIFIAPKILGGLNSMTPFDGRGVKKLMDAYSIEDTKMRRIGCDYLLEGYLKKPQKVMPE
jgi:diaminohydroxyphosphoribosylaminopyrimidine deaminase / 5-amino-6-(5-phosphoribosylamino)uracil reductase